MNRRVLPPICRHCGEQDRTCHSKLVRLHRYWEEKRRGRGFPSRGDIDPLDLVEWLPNIFLVDVGAGPSFRYRLAGTGVEEIHGQSLTGKRPADIKTPEVAKIVEQQYIAVLHDRRPRCDHLALLGNDGSYWHYERLILPLAGEDGAIDMFLCGIYRA